MRQKAKVAKIHHTGDRIDGIELESGEMIKCGTTWMRAATRPSFCVLNVQVDAPTLLRNIAFWDYWEKPGMNRSMMHKEAIRIHIRSIGYGWVWYIVLSDDRTSVGVVMPAEHYKKLGKKPEQIYHESLALEQTVTGFLKGAKERGSLQSTNDWSYIADRGYGENWFLCGESLGFADPILSAGMTLTHTCGRHLAYLIMELDRGELDKSGCSSSTTTSSALTRHPAHEVRGLLVHRQLALRRDHNVHGDRQGLGPEDGPSGSVPLAEQRRRLLMRSAGRHRRPRPCRHQAGAATPR